MRGAKGSTGVVKTELRQKAGTAKWKSYQDKYAQRKKQLYTGRPVSRVTTVAPAAGPVKKIQRLKKK